MAEKKKKDEEPVEPAGEAKPEAAEDFALITKQVPVSNAALAVVEKYFRAKTGAEEALKLAQTAVKTSADAVPPVNGVRARLDFAEYLGDSVKLHMDLDGQPFLAKVLEREQGISTQRRLQISQQGYILDQGRCVLQGPAQGLLADERMAQLYLGNH